MKDPRILRTCPFCGESEFLSCGHSIERPVLGPDGVLLDGAGREITECAEAVVCAVCEAMAPLDVWNGQRPQSHYVALRDFDPPPAITATPPEGISA